MGLQMSCIMNHDLSRSVAEPLQVGPVWLVGLMHVLVHCMQSVICQHI